MMSMALQLRKKRLEKGLQQKEMAYALQISAPAYSRYESGKTVISVDMAAKIAAILQISVSDLMDSRKDKVGMMEHENPIPGGEPLLPSQVARIIDKSLNYADQVLKISEQMIALMENQNNLLKEMIRITKRNY